jgi:hypothetical protein
MDHKDIKYVWYDYACMPQKESKEGKVVDNRSHEEKAQFDLMLKAVTDLYLSAQVLILLDVSSRSRFWPLTEAWNAMQKTTEQGVQPAEENETRYTITPIHSAEKADVDALIRRLRTKTPEEMYDILDASDVTMTNMKDKENIMPKILRINEAVKKVYGDLDA